MTQTQWGNMNDQTKRDWEKQLADPRTWPPAGREVLERVLRQALAQVLVKAKADAREVA